ncbi:MAG: VWA domain-containing protein, partial [Gammaproteobacteria bacterium]
RRILKVSLILVSTSLFAEDINTDIDLDSIEAALVTPEELLDEKSDNIEPETIPEITSDDSIIEDALDVVENLESEMEEFTDSIEEALYTNGEDISVSSDAFIKDVVLVLDNSGSMKKNDPGFLVKDAVKEFISQQDENTRVAIVIFDQDVNLSVPLTSASLANRESILNSLENINYKGLFTDSPAGIERAIYELKNNGRADAQKSIIFMTDGIVDTGAAEKDLEKSKWLREDLAPDAADNNIKIFGIAFTEKADFQLIQSISQNTNGEYYRALTVDDIQNKFGQIDQLINTPPPEPEVVQPVIVEQAAPVVEQAPAPAPVIIEVPVQSMGEEERIRSIIMIAAAIVLTLTLLGILILLIRRNKELKAGGEPVVQEAYINDLQGKTDKQTHKLSSKPTMFGRVAGKDTEHLDYIVVNESTIGRRHALIEFKDYSYWIIDQGSINGTFVNGQSVSSEVRLKHGDRIRLHKCDFEFIMPEMEDSGMTVVSNTVFAGQSATSDAEEATVMKAHDSSADATEIISDIDVNIAAASEMDFDITGTSAISEQSVEDESSIDPDLPPDGDDIEESLADETIMLEENSDETIMLDDDLSDDEDPTLRKDDV